MLAIVVAPQEPRVVCLLLNAVGDGRGLCLSSWRCQSASLSWFRGGFPEFGVPMKVLQAGATHLVPLYLQWEELEAEKAEITG